MRREVLAGIHAGHFGETKCVLRAKSSVFWPGYIDHVRNVVASCSACQENRNRNPKLPLNSAEVPTHPFQMVSADLFQLRGVHYLLIVDAYSKWPCAVSLKSETSAACISELDRIFADFGVPEELKTDNGPQFASAELRALCAKKGVRLVTSSPEHARSNGMAEWFVETVKNVIVKTFNDGNSLWDALTAIRSTPVSSHLPSPVVLLQGRNLRGNLPLITSQLQPNLISSKAESQELRARQMMAQFNNSRSPSQRGSALEINQRVWVRVSEKWIQGKIAKICQELHSYLVATQDGRMFRRTREAINMDKSQPTEPTGRAQDIPDQNRLGDHR